MYEQDYLRAGREPEKSDLLDNLEYKMAYKLALNASLPDKGERPNRDPQVNML